ncbi:MAG: hypothetical protein Q8Q39_01345 [bacterium]|nr:hypothetical protein [bacterium]
MEAQTYPAYEIPAATTLATIGQASKTYPLQTGAPDALVLHCSDPRFQEAFHDFIHGELGIQMPAPICIPGSSAAFGVQTVLPKGWNALRRQLELLTKDSKFSRVVLINHDDCKGYGSIAQYLGGLARVGKEQKTHLKKLATFILSEYLPGARLELYHARIVQNGGEKAVQFEKVL